MTDEEYQYLQRYGEPRDKREKRIQNMAALLGAMVNPGFTQIYKKVPDPDPDPENESG